MGLVAGEGVFMGAFHGVTEPGTVDRAIRLDARVHEVVPLGLMSLLGQGAHGEGALVTFILTSTTAAALSARLQGWGLCHLGISVGPLEQRRFGNRAQEVLHPESLEYFSFLL